MIAAHAAHAAHADAPPVGQDTALPPIPAAYGGDPIPGWPDAHMLEAAMGLLANAVAFDPATGWDTARQEWMDAYHRWLGGARQRPRGAVVEIIERVRTPAQLATLDDPTEIGVIVPNEVRINDQPLLITEEGPKILSIDCGNGDRGGPVLVTMTVIARRVIIDAEGPE